MKREVTPELLDSLPPDDPGAIGSRKDLQRLNAWMGNGRIMARALRSGLNDAMPRRIVDLGAGDGTFMLDLARRLSSDWVGTTVMLVDQSSVVSPLTCQALRALGWQVELTSADVFDWLREPAPRSVEVVIANLFLHHFDEIRLKTLLCGIARQTQVFIGVEPRRSAWSFEVSRRLELIGCNRVTRHDAPVSVRSGFARNELSQLWPVEAGWRLEEHPAGCFSHLFVARSAE